MKFFLLLSFFLLFLSPLTWANPWEHEIVKFEQKDRAHPPAPGQVLFVGSSSIVLWDSIAESFPHLQFLNRGFGGSEVSDLVHFYRRIITKYHPSKIVLYSGDNDIYNGESPETVMADFETLIWLIHEQIDCPLYILAIKPSPGRHHLTDQYRRANQLIKEYAPGNPRVTFIDSFELFLDDQGGPDPQYYRPDGIHLNRKGYQIWVDALRGFLGPDQ